MEQGRITPATVADHHPPHDGDWNKFVLGELRSLLALGSVGYEDKPDEGRRKTDLAGGRDGGPAGAMRGPGESYSAGHPAADRDGGRVCPIAWLGLLLAHIAIRLAARRSDGPLTKHTNHA
jgi:hypothetical protein